MVASPSAVIAGTETFANPPGGIGTSYSESSGVQGTPPFSSVGPEDPPGTYSSFESAPLPAALDVVGLPTVTVSISSSVPDGVDPATDPVIVAKLYDLAPDGTKILVDNLMSPVRVASKAAPVVVTLPGVVHQYAAGDRLDLVLAAGDGVEPGNRTPDSYTVRVDPGQPSSLVLPVVPPSGQEVGPPPTGD